MKIYKKSLEVPNGTFNALDARVIQHHTINSDSYYDNDVVIFDVDDKLAVSSSNTDISIDIGKALISGTRFVNDTFTTITPSKPASGSAKGYICMSVDTLAPTAQQEYFEDVLGSSTAFPVLTQGDLTQSGQSLHQVAIASYTIDQNGFITDFVDLSSGYLFDGRTESAILDFATIDVSPEDIAGLDFDEMNNILISAGCAKSPRRSFKIVQAIGSTFDAYVDYYNAYNVKLGESGRFQTSGVPNGSDGYMTEITVPRVGEGLTTPNATNFIKVISQKSQQSHQFVFNAGATPKINPLKIINEGGSYGDTSAYYRATLDIDVDQVMRIFFPTDFMSPLSSGGRVEIDLNADMLESNTNIGYIANISVFQDEFGDTPVTWSGLGTGLVYTNGVFATNNSYVATNLAHIPAILSKNARATGKIVIGGSSTDINATWIGGDTVFNATNGNIIGARGQYHCTTGFPNFKGIKIDLNGTAQTCEVIVKVYDANNNFVYDCIVELDV